MRAVSRCAFPKTEWTAGGSDNQAGVGLGSNGNTGAGERVFGTGGGVGTNPANPRGIAMTETTDNFLSKGYGHGVERSKMLDDYFGAAGAYDPDRMKPKYAQGVQHEELNVFDFDDGANKQGRDTTSSSGNEQQQYDSDMRSNGSYGMSALQAEQERAARSQM